MAHYMVRWQFTGRVRKSDGCLATRPQRDSKNACREFRWQVASLLLRLRRVQRNRHLRISGCRRSVFYGGDINRRVLAL
jgi:hypothetical protein